MSTHRRRLRRWAVVIALTLALLVGGAVIFLRVQFHGGALADAVESMLDANMRGRIQIGSIEWPMGALPKVVTGGWVPVTLHDVDVWDADGKQILHVERIDAELDVHALMFGNHDFVLRRVVFDQGWVILEEIPEPYPLHDYDTTVFSLLAAFYGERQPGFYLGATAASPPVFDLHDVTLREIDFTLLLKPYDDTVDGKPVTAHAFTAQIQNASGRGFFYTDPSDPLVPKLYFSVPSSPEPVRAERAEIAVVGGYRFSLVDFELRQLAQLPTSWPEDPVANHLLFEFAATSVEGANIHARGALLDYWDSPYGGTYDVDVSITNAGAMARASIDPWMGGERLTIHAEVTGPILYPRARATLTDLEYDVDLRDGLPPLKLYLDKAVASFDLATETGALEETTGRVEQPGGDGEVQLSATFGISPYHANANVMITEPIDLAAYLPPDVTRIVGSRIHGAFHADGDSDFVLRVDGFDLHLGRVHIDRGAIVAENELEDIYLEDLRLRADGTTLRLDGEIATTPETFELTIDVDSRDLDAWLRRADLPPLARTATGRGIAASGSLTDPSAGGSVRLGGVPIIDDLSLTFGYAGGVLDIHRGRSSGVGTVDARGRVRVQGAPRIERLVVTGRGIDLGKLPVPDGTVAGKADLDVVATGPATSPRIDATLVGDDLTLFGVGGASVRACYNHDPSDPRCGDAAAAHPGAAQACVADAARGGQCLLAAITRPSGGRAQVIAGTDRAGRLGGKLTVDDLSLDAVAQLAGSGELPAGGVASVSLDLAGTLAAPTAAGTMSMLRTWLFGAYLGDERFQIRVAATDDPVAECADDPPPPPRGSTGKLALCGELRDGRIRVAAVLGTSGTMPVKARVDMRRVEVDPFIDLAAVLGAPAPLRAWTSGTITIDTELARKDAPLDIQLELPEIALLVERDDADGRPAPLVVSAATPLSLHFDGTTATLGRPVTFRTPAGELTLSGTATAARLALELTGDLDLAEVEPLLAAFVDQASGRIRVDADIAGSADAPRIDATLALAGISLRPAGQDTELKIEKATLDLTPERGLSFGEVKVEVVDRSSGEAAVLTAKGGIKLDGLTPVRWGVIVDGELAGKLLVALAPQQLSQASGKARLDLVVSGDGARPTIAGGLTFDPARPFAVMPRGLRRDIVLSRGRIEFTEREIVLDNLSGSIDGEGRISRVSGVIDLVDLSPVAGDVSLSADGLPFRIPRTLDLVLSADELRLVWGDDIDDDGDADLEIEGAIEVVQGRYVREFNFFGEVLRPEDGGGGSTKPFWDEYPMLGDARLALTIDARSLSVENNIANVELAGEVRLEGTPRAPLLDGEIQVQRGTFKPQFTRARFTRTTGSVQFERYKPFPGETPTLAIASEADYRDSSGQDHLITLRLDGPLSRLTWDLTTSSGLNKSQTLTLIVAGRAPDDVRRAADPLDSDPTRIDPTTNPTAGATDQFLKDFAGDFISLLVADPLKDVNFLDVMRIEVGTGSIGLHAEEKLGSATNIVGDYETTIRGSTINLRLEIKSTTGLVIQFGGLKKDYDDPAEEDVTDVEGKVVYRWFFL